MSRLSVLLTTEGTYPFHKGGVSTWCHELTQNLPEIEYTLLALIMHPYLQQRYEPPPNVRHVIKVPMWGIEGPAEYSWHHPFSNVLRNRWDTTESVIATKFMPSFEKFISAVLVPDRNGQELGETLLAMHTYFLRYDYPKTMRADVVWDFFQRSVRAAWQARARNAVEPSIKELTESLRLLYHFLVVLHFPVPRTDVTHSAAAAFCGLPCVIAKLQRGTPYLLTEHGVYVREQYLNLKRNIPSEFVCWFLYQLVGAVVAVNYHFADQISPVCAYNARWEEWWGVPPERIKVIYNGVDPERFRPIESESNSRPQVANIGLIFPLKGQIDLIDAAAIVRAQIPNIEFRLYGSASDQDYFTQCQERVRTHKLEETVVFAGLTSEPWRVYSEADVVAFASNSEGFPYVVIEAMLSGAAIISTDVGGVSEALADKGLLVRPRRPADLAQGILSLLQLSPEERKKFGEQARIRALQLFTRTKFLDDYRETYFKLSQGQADEQQED